MLLRKVAELACAVAGILGFTHHALGAVQLLDFEGLDYDRPPFVSVGSFTNYGGLDWANGSSEFPGWINVRSDGECSAPCGFVTGRTSGVQIATQIHGLTSTIGRADPFRALSVQLSSAWRNGEQVTFAGFLNGSQVWSSSHLLYVTSGPGAGAPTLVNFNSGLINELRVSSMGGVLDLALRGSSAGAVIDDFRYDDLVGSAVPEPATWAMTIIGFAFLGSAMRRRGNRKLLHS